MQPSSLKSWLRHPHAASLLRFALLPACFIHPGRAAGIPEALAPLPSLHRHRSRALLRRNGLDPAVDCADPALPLALLPERHFERFVLQLGVSLNSLHVRRTVAREELAQLKEQLGADAYSAARGAAAAALAGLPPQPDWEIARARELCSLWGQAVLHRAFEAATPPVGKRGHLRLAPEAEELGQSLAAAGLDPSRALQAGLELLGALEPAWHTSFQKTR